MKHRTTHVLLGVAVALLGVDLVLRLSPQEATGQELEWRIDSELPARPRLPLSLILRDGNGNIMGNVVDVGTYGNLASTLVEVELSSGDRANVFLRIAKESGLQAGGATLVFSGANCTGNAFLNGAAFPPAITASAVNDSAGVKMLCVATTDTPVSLSIRSYLSGSNCINFPEPITLDVFPAELVDSDFEMTFPPPYTLEIE